MGLRSLRKLSLSGNDMSNIATIKEQEKIQKESRKYSTSYTRSSDEDFDTSNTPKPYPSLKELDNLQQLEIENCNLSHVDGELFGDNTKLKVIKLGGNNLTFLSEGIFARQVFLQDL